MKTAVFLERDGVLNHVEVAGTQQIVPKCVSEFRVKTAIRPLLARLKQAGHLLIVTTNQPGVSRGYLPRREMDLMHELLRRSLPVDDIFACPHDEMDDCPCRKPGVGLLTEAAFKHQLNLEQSFVVSDKWQDAKAAEQVGATSLLLRSPWNGSCHHDFILPSLKAVTERILTLTSHPHYAVD